MRATIRVARPAQGDTSVALGAGRATGFRGGTDVEERRPAEDRMISMTSRAVYLASWLALAVMGCASDDEAALDAGNAPGDGDGDAVTTGEECFADLEAPDVGFVELQRFESEDGSVRVWRARQPGDRMPVGETFPYDLKRAWIETEDEPGTCVTAVSALSYEFGHHNWAEEWTVTTDHAQYIGREMYSTTSADTAQWDWTDTLEAQDDRGETLFMVGLVDDGCESMPYDLNPCMLRMRTDEPPPGWGEE
jgi:hypothetical protein